MIARGEAALDIDAPGRTSERWSPGAPGGDARNALNILEAAAATAGDAPVSEELVEDAARKRPLVYDKGGDAHYDFTSAFIKSMRGSDPDAAVYYLAAMLEGGEDARFIARRMVILASEDVGNADPQALVVAVAAAQAVEHVGLPEAQLNLAQAAIYLALAPKSNAVTVALERGDRTTSARSATSGRRRSFATPTTPARRSSAMARGYVYPARRPGGVRPRPPARRAEGTDVLPAVRAARPPRARSRPGRSDVLGGPLTMNFRAWGRAAETFGTPLIVEFGPR